MASKKLSSDTSLANSYKLSRGVASVARPSAPTIGTGTDTGSGAMSVTFTASTLGPSATSFTLTSSSGVTASGASSPLTLTEVAIGTYTYTVSGVNANGTGPSSVASNSVNVASITPPYSYESIQTVTVGAGGQVSVAFTSIPTGTYKHLQIQYVARSTRSLPYDAVVFRLNGDTGANYFNHLILGDGLNNPPGSYGYTSQSKNLAGYVTAANAPANSFGTGTIDITDAFSTTKYKTNQCVAGTAVNSVSGTSTYYYLSLSSGSWANTTDPISSITFTTDIGSNFAQYSTFALYGIRG